MEYQVPQFIEVEDHIVGPLTLKQFLYIAGGAGLCVVFFLYTGLVYAIILSIPVIAFVAALAFYRVNGKPFIDVLEAGFNYYTREKLFLWKHETPARSATPAAAAPVREAPAPRLTRGKLSELAWSLDVQQAGGSDDERES
jgi:hypothetical protein